MQLSKLQLSQKKLREAAIAWVEASHKPVLGTDIAFMKVDRALFKAARAYAKEDRI